MQANEKEVCRLEIEEIFMTYKTDVYRYLVSLTHDLTVAEDLLSETFLRALQNLGSFQGKSTIKTWLFGIARNVWLQSLRKNKESVEFSDFLGLYVREDEMCGELYGKELAVRVRDLLLQQSEKNRQVMKMRIEGFSQTEISMACGISENSVRVIEFRTKKWLKEKLQKEGSI